MDIKEIAMAKALRGGGGTGNANIDVTAEVGQTIIVKEVDENGKPAEWEAHDVPKIMYLKDVENMTGEEFVNAVDDYDVVIFIPDSPYDPALIMRNRYKGVIGTIDSQTWLYYDAYGLRDEYAHRLSIKIPADDDGFGKIQITRGSNPMLFTYANTTFNYGDMLVYDTSTKAWMPKAKSEIIVEPVILKLPAESLVDGITIPISGTEFYECTVKLSSGASMIIQCDNEVEPQMIYVSSFVTDMTTFSTIVRYVSPKAGTIYSMTIQATE